MPASPVAAPKTRSIFQKVRDSSSSLYTGQSPRHPPCQSTNTSASGVHTPPTRPVQRGGTMLWFLTQCQAWGQDLPSLMGPCPRRTGDYPLPVLPQQTEASWEGSTLGGGSSPPGLISMSGGNTNIVSETARPAGGNEGEEEGTSFIEHLLCTRPYSRHSTCVISL